jgi:PAS domain S-box-containing protein
MKLENKSKDELITELTDLRKKYQDLEKLHSVCMDGEENLKTEQNKMHALLDGLSLTKIGVDIVDNNYNIIYQNQILEERFGAQPGKLCYEKYLKRKKPCTDCPMIRSFNSGKVERAELIGSDGRTYEVISAPLPNPEGTIEEAIEVILDITERKQAEVDLKGSEENYRSIFNSVNDAIMIHDAKNGRPIDTNPKMLELLGYSKEELIKMKVEDWTVGDPTIAKKKALQRIKEAAGGFPQLFEWKVKRKDNKQIWVEVNLKSAVIMGQNRVLAVVRDITKRKQEIHKISHSWVNGIWI